VGQIDGTDQIDGVLDGQRYAIIPGPAYEPHVAHLNGQYAVCARTPHGAALVLSADFVRVVPDPEPQPEPEPEPETPMLLPDDVFATLQAIRPKYPTPLGQHGAALLNEVAWIHRAQGWGLESKQGGNVCSQPTTGTTCGCDILRTIDKGWDVLVDTEGAGEPKQAESGPADPARFVAPVPPSGVPDPEPKPEPSDLAARVKVLEDRANIQGMALQEQAARLNLQAADLSALKVRVAALEAGDPPPSYESIYVTVRTGAKTYAGTLPVEG